MMTFRFLFNLGGIQQVKRRRSAVRIFFLQFFLLDKSQPSLNILQGEDVRNHKNGFQANLPPKDPFPPKRVVSFFPKILKLWTTFKSLVKPFKQTCYMYKQYPKMDAFPCVYTW